MGERVPESDLPERLPEERLDSWKEIAAYLRRDVTTVQRWEKREGMPVHRHVHGRIGSVWATKAELDAWIRSRSVAPDASPGGGAVPAARTRTVVLVACGVALIAAAAVWLRRSEALWRSPIADARVWTLTDFDASAQAAAVSRDGKFVAFLSDRDGPTDVFVTQVGSGQFHNLTNGGVRELVNPSVRTLGFTPDGSLVTFWVRRPDGSEPGAIGIWAVPTLGGRPREYLEGAAELDWSRDGTRLAFHTAGPGDPLFVSDGPRGPRKLVFTAPAGRHSHFPLWAPGDAFLYFVEGVLPDKLDVWRVRADGGDPERVTSHAARVSHPVWTGRTLLYLASDADGSGPYLHSMDVSRRVPHRLTPGPDRYTSLAANADGRRLVATIARSKRTLWRVRFADGTGTEPAPPARLALATGTGFAPRFAASGVVYAAATGTGESIWKLEGDSGHEIWNGRGAKLLGGPAVSPDGRAVAFSLRQDGKAILQVMKSDGSELRVLSDALDLQGAPAWAPDGGSVAVAALEAGSPRVFRVPVHGGGASPLVTEYALDPAWGPDGLLVFSGPDVGASFSVKAVGANGAPRSLPALTLTRGARRFAFAAGGRAIVYLHGDLQHRDLWLADLATGAERRLTRVPPNFDVRDFDVSPDGREAVLERAEERADVVLLDLPPE